MRRTATFFAMLLMGCAASAHAPTATAQQGSRRGAGSDGAASTQQWLGGAPAQTQVWVGDDGETYVGVWIEAPDRPRRNVERPPMAVSLVIDTSGSMSGDKIRHARVAAQSLIETLRPGDMVSIYGFDNDVTQIAAPTTVGPATQGELLHRVGAVQAGGGTNMYGGLSAGMQPLSRAPDSHAVRRVVLISDGHANIGPSDPRSLGELAARGTEWGAQVTAIGVGLDYDEHTLGQLAVRSSGRMYHLEHSHQMAHILEQELDLLAHTLATDAYIEIVPAPGVRILEGKSLGSEMRGGKLRVSLGSVHAGQQREILFRASVDTQRVGQHPLARAQLVYREPDAGARKVQKATLRYGVTRDRSKADASASGRVEAMVASHHAAEAQMQAAERLNRGDSDGAMQQLRQARSHARRAAASASDDRERRRYRSQQKKIDSVMQRAGGARSPTESRAAALESYDSAVEAQGY